MPTNRLLLLLLLLLRLMMRVFTAALDICYLYEGGHCSECSTPHNPHNHPTLTQLQYLILIYIYHIFTMQSHIANIWRNRCAINPGTQSCNFSRRTRNLHSMRLITRLNDLIISSPPVLPPPLSSLPSSSSFTY